MSADIEASVSRSLQSASRPPAGRRPEGSSIFDDGTPTAEELEVIDWLLTTTRSNRKTLDLGRPVEPEIIEECLEIALQAPTAHNTERWHWLVVTDEEKKAAVADVYRRTWYQVTRGERKKGRRWKGSVEDNAAAERVQDSANWLPDHMHEVPAIVIPCMVGPRYNSELIIREYMRHMEANGPDYGLTDPPSTMWIDAGYFASIYPAVWHFQLALRSRGLGSTLTINHLAAERLVNEALGLPELVVPVALLPVAYTTKRTFKRANRSPLESRLSWEKWLGTR